MKIGDTIEAKCGYCEAQSTVEMATETSPEFDAQRRAHITWEWERTHPRHQWPTESK